MDLAPICLFTYNRLAETIKTVEALKGNELASESDLIIFSDGPKNNDVSCEVEVVRQFLKTIDGFKSVTVRVSHVNKGLASSIILGVSEVVRKYGRVIVLEDDLITSPNFLSFMNAALDFYAGKSVFSISGFSLKIVFPKNFESDVYFTRRASSWGWGTWATIWEKIDWEVLDYREFRQSRAQKREFNLWGSDLSSMLYKQMNGDLDSWAIRWCYNQYRLNLLTVVPRISLVKNSGFGKTASNTIGFDRYPVHFDNGSFKNYRFSAPKINEFERRQFSRFYSVWYRALFFVIDRARRLFL